MNQIVYQRLKQKLSSGVGVSPALWLAPTEWLFDTMVLCNQLRHESVTIEERPLGASQQEWPTDEWISRYGKQLGGTRSKKNRTEEKLLPRAWKLPLHSKAVKQISQFHLQLTFRLFLSFSLNSLLATRLFTSHSRAQSHTVNYILLHLFKPFKNVHSAKNYWAAIYQSYKSSSQAF